MKYTIERTSQFKKDFKLAEKQGLDLDELKGEKEMYDIRIATKEDIDILMSSRLEMLRVVNDLSDDYDFSEEMINESRDYFLNGDHLTILAMDGNDVIGCSSISFIRMMPTFDHITGKRAHLMNVYTKREYRHQGIARRMVQLLIEESWKAGATEISLDATELGRPLYESLGFIDSAECMVLAREKYD